MSVVLTAEGLHVWLLSCIRSDTAVIEVAKWHVDQSRKGPFLGWINNHTGDYRRSDIKILSTLSIVKDILTWGPWATSVGFNGLSDCQSRFMNLDMLSQSIRLWTASKKIYCGAKQCLWCPPPGRSPRCPTEIAPEELMSLLASNWWWGPIPYFSDKLLIIGMAVLKAGNTIEFMKNPEAKVSSHMIPSINSSARMPSTKAFLTVDKIDLRFSWFKKE